MTGRSPASRPVVVVLEGDVPATGLDEVAADADLVATDAARLPEALTRADALLLWDFFSEDAATQLSRAVPSRLDWIHVAAAGVDAILTPAVVASGVRVTNAAGVFDRPIAEYVLACVSAHAKQLPCTLERQRERVWRQRVTTNLAGLRVVVLGAGGIGSEVARLLTAVGMTVRLVARTARDTPDGPVAALPDLPALLAEADVFVVALPATAETERIVDARTIAMLRPHCLFVNVGRGRTVDEDALRAALRDGRLGGAVLDAFEVEPLPEGDPLWGDPRVIVSPHTSSRTEGWRDRLAAQFVEQYRDWRAGAPMSALVDKARGY